LENILDEAEYLRNRPKEFASICENFRFKLLKSIQLIDSTYRPVRIGETTLNAFTNSRPFAFIRGSVHFLVAAESCSKVSVCFRG